MEVLEKYERRLALKAESTRRNYRYALNKFLKKIDLTQEGLIELAKGDLDEVELLVAEVMKAEMDEGKKPTTARLIYKAVRFFLKSVGFKDFGLEREDKPRAVYSGSRRTTEEHIRELYDSFTAKFRRRNRAILMFLKDSGLRVSDACNLDAEHYRAGREIPQDGERFVVFGPFATLKTGDFAHIHIGPEAIEALDEYLRGRETGPLFRNQYGGRMSPKAMSEVFGKVKRRRDLEEDYRGISAHSLRKYHFTRLPIRDEWIKWLQGKATDVYVDDPEVTEAYIQAYDKLRVFPSRVREDAERDRRIQELEAQLARWTEKFGDVEDLDKRMEYINDKLIHYVRVLEKLPSLWDVDIRRLKSYEDAIGDTEVYKNELDRKQQGLEEGWKLIKKEINEIEEINMRSKHKSDKK